MDEEKRKHRLCGEEKKTLELKPMSKRVCEIKRKRQRGQRERLLQDNRRGLDWVKH